jgi:hypothetical protein
MLGCCIPRDPSKQTNKMINEALERDRKEMNAESKLLLLGNHIKYFLKIIQIKGKRL